MVVPAISSGRKPRLLAPALVLVACLAVVCLRAHTSRLQQTETALLDTSVPTSWMSASDAAASPLLNAVGNPVAFESPQVSSQLHASMNPEPATEELAAKPPVDQAKPSTSRNGEDSLRHLTTEGEQLGKKIHVYGQQPSKAEWHAIVKKAEEYAHKEARKHPRDILGAHWRSELDTTSSKQATAQAEAAARRAAKRAAEHLKKLHDAHLKQIGIYAPEPVLHTLLASSSKKTAPSATEARSSAEAPATTLHEPVQSDSSPPSSTSARASPPEAQAGERVPPETPMRYPAVSFFARMRALHTLPIPGASVQLSTTSNSGHAHTGQVLAARSSDEMGKLSLQQGGHLSRLGRWERTELHELARRRRIRAQHPGSDSAMGTAEAWSRGDATSSLYQGEEPPGEPRGNRRPPPAVAPPDPALAQEWEEMMRRPPPVTDATRPDIRDTRSYPYPDKHWASKKKEMQRFGAAIEAYEVPLHPRCFSFPPSVLRCRVYTRSRDVMRLHTSAKHPRLGRVPAVVHHTWLTFCHAIANGFCDMPMSLALLVRLRVHDDLQTLRFTPSSFKPFECCSYSSPFFFLKSIAEAVP